MVGEDSAESKVFRHQQKCHADLQDNRGDQGQTVSGGCCVGSHQSLGNVMQAQGWVVNQGIGIST